MLTQDRPLTTTAATALRDRFPGSVAVPGDDGFDEARGAFNLMLEQHPDAIAAPGSVAEAAEIVVAARQAGLRIAPQGSSHNIGPLGSLEGALLIKLERMTAVEIDRAGATARVEAGARWWDLVGDASAMGLAARHGSSSEINIAGYSLGGGVGWLARKHGLQTNAVTAIEVITADGRRRLVDADNEPDLFWALRGGGGNFGLVTALEFDLVPVSTLHAGALFFEFERASEVLHAYREWTADLPEEITSVGRTLQLPDLPEVPELVRGRSFAIVEAAHLGDADEASELLAPLRRLGPAMDTFADVPPAALADLHMDPVDPVPALTEHSMLGRLSERAIDEALAAVGPGTGSPVSFEVRHLGGALSRSDARHGALDTMRGEYMTFAIVPVMDPSAVDALQADLDRVQAAFAPDDSGRYLNFTEEAHPVEDMFEAATLRRLREVRDAYDPERIFMANHAV